VTREIEMILNSSLL